MMESKNYPNIGETLYTGRLPNGLSLYVIPKPDYRRSFALFATHYGGAMGRFTLDGEKLDTPAGVAHFLEHKMFDMPDGSNALGTLSASGASPNAFTGYDMTAYHFSCTDRFEENLDYLLSFVSTPYYSAESVRKEQGIIGQEIRMTEDNPGFRVYVELMRALYGDCPMGHSVAGTVESIAEITDKTLYDCHRAFYRPSNMTLCVMGGIDPLSVARIAEKVLSDESGDAPEPIYEGALLGSPVTARVETPMEVSAPQFLIGAKVAPAEKGVALLRQQLTAELSLKCLMGRSSPFYTGLYAQGLLTNDFGYEFSYAGGSAAVAAGGESADPDRVLEHLVDEAGRVGRDGLDSELFRRVSRAAYGGRLTALDSFESQCVALANGCFYGYNDLDALELLPEIGEDDCAAFIRDSLSAQAMAISVITPRKGK